MSSFFLSGNEIGGLDDGTADLYINSQRIGSLLPNLPVKTDIGKNLQSSKLLIADTDGLQQALDSTVANPLQADLDCANRKVVNLDNTFPMQSRDAVNYQTFTDEVKTLDIEKVSKSGDTMNGILNMGGSKVVNVDNTLPLQPGDAVNYQTFVDEVKTLDIEKVSKSGDTMSGNLDMGANKITSTYDVVTDYDLTNKKYVDDRDLFLQEQITSGSGDITALEAKTQYQTVVGGTFPVTLFASGVQANDGLITAQKTDSAPAFIANRLGATPLVGEVVARSIVSNSDICSEIITRATENHSVGNKGCSLDISTSRNGATIPTLCAEFKEESLRTPELHIGTHKTTPITIDRGNVNNVLQGGEAAYPNIQATATDNVAYGERALSAVTTGSSNTCIGDGAGERMQNADWNTCLGQYAGELVISGSEMVAVGKDSCNKFPVGGGNTGVGYGALANATSTNVDARNVALGYQAGFNNGTSIRTVCVGPATRAVGDYGIAIGNQAQVNGVHGIALGNQAVAAANEIKLSADIVQMSPSTTNTIDIGTNLLKFKDAYFNGTLECPEVKAPSGPPGTITLAQDSFAGGALVGGTLSGDATFVAGNYLELTSSVASPSTSTGAITYSIPSGDLGTDVTFQFEVYVTDTAGDDGNGFSAWWGTTTPLLSNSTAGNTTFSCFTYSPLNGTQVQYRVASNGAPQVLGPFVSSIPNNTWTAVKFVVNGATLQGYVTNMLTPVYTVVTSTPILGTETLFGLQAQSNGTIDTAYRVRNLSITRPGIPPSSLSLTSDILNHNAVTQDTSVSVYGQLLSADTLNIVLAAGEYKEISVGNVGPIVFEVVASPSGIVPSTTAFEFAITETGLYAFDANVNVSPLNQDACEVHFVIYKNGVATPFHSITLKMKTRYSNLTNAGLIRCNAGDTLSLHMGAEASGDTIAMQYISFFVQKVRQNVAV